MKTTLTQIIDQLTGNGRGLLAMDESIATCNRRFAAVDIPQTESARRAYRFLLVTTPNLSQSISGVILHDETIRQRSTSGTSMVDVVNETGMIAGIKVDTGKTDLAGSAGEKVTEGLDGLRQRLQSYYNMGARVAKWRAVFSVSALTPTHGCIEANANALARYAALCQEVGLVPIIEPEVLMDGEHRLEKCAEATQEVLRVVFQQMHSQNVSLEELILKANMILPGSRCVDQSSTNEIAAATLKCLLRSVPAAVPAVAFLSGGQSAELASERLNGINQIGCKAPWALTFSFARALQQPALNIWRGDDQRRASAQKVLGRRAECDRAARSGTYRSTMELT